MDNVAAALTPGGRVVLLDVLGYADPEVDELFGRITRIRQPTDYKFFSKPELEAMFARAGFSITDFKSQSFKLDLRRWLGEYEEPERVLSMFEQAPAKAKEAFHYRAVEGRPTVEFSTYLLVGQRRP